MFLIPKCSKRVFVIHHMLSFLAFDAGSVSDDYLQYMLLQFPTNITGWICDTLVTSSLLKACQSNSGHYFCLGMSIRKKETFSCC